MPYPYYFLTCLLTAVILGRPCVARTSDSTALFFRETNNLKAYELKGKVRSVARYNYSIYNLKPGEKGDWETKMVSYFDNNGRLTAEQGFRNTNGKEVPVMDFLYVYDGSNRLVIVKTRTGRIVRKSVFSYNTNKRLMEDVYDSNPKAVSDTLVRVRRIIYRENSPLQDTIQALSPNGKIRYATIISYNYRDSILTYSGIDATGKELQSSEGKYNKFNKLVYFAYTYYTQTGIDYGKKDFQYDNNGNLLFEIHTKEPWYEGMKKPKPLPDGTNIYKNKEVEIDSCGNWLQQTQIINEQPVTLVKRQIEYY